MREKSFLVVKYIYLLFIFIILSAMLQVIDFRLGFTQGFSLLNVLVDILFFISIFVYMIKGDFFLFEGIKNVQLYGCVCIVYLVIIIIISISRNNNFVMSILAIKNLIFPMLVLIGGAFISHKIRKTNILKLIKLINFFEIINIILVLLGFKYGWEIITGYILGESLYAFPIYSFTHSSSMARVPGLFVDALTQGAFSYLVFIVNLIIFIDNKYIKRKYSLLFMFISIGGIILSTNRQVILATFIFIIILLSLKYRKLAIVFICFGISGSIAFLMQIVNSNIDIFSLESFNIRMGIWGDVIKDMNISQKPMNLFWGTGVNATVLGKESSTVELVDNGYLLILHDYGVIGLILFVLFILSILICFCRHFYKDSIIKISLGYCIFFIVRMFFHSSIVNVYDSYMFCLITLIGLSKVIELKSLNSS